MFRRIRRAAFQANRHRPGPNAIPNQSQSVGLQRRARTGCPLFANLATEMETILHPRRAANLHAQAAHAYADSQNEQAALNQARLALNLFIQNPR